MAQFQRHFVQELTEPIRIRQCGDLGFTGDNDSDVISVDLYTNGEEYAGGGECAGACIRPDGTTLALTGSVSGKTASVILKEHCFDIPGQIGIGIRVTTGTTKTTVLKAIYNVELFATDTPVDPGSQTALDVADLINRIDTAVASIPASADQLKAAMAQNFSDTTAYPSGAYVWHNGNLYHFTADHAAGSWTGTDAAQVALGNDVADLKVEIKYKADNKYGGNEISSGIVMQNRSGWSGTSGNLINNVNNRASSPLITITPEMKSVVCAEGYSMAVYANNAGVGNPMTNIGASSWVTSASLENIDYTYFVVSIRRSDAGDFPEGTTSGVVSIIRYADILPYALSSDLDVTNQNIANIETSVETISGNIDDINDDISELGTNVTTLSGKVAENEGERFYVVPLKSGTINSAGQEQSSRTDRLVSTEYLYISQYTGDIEIPEYHSILIAYFDASFRWISNSQWVNTCNVSELLEYPYIRIVLRNNQHINDDISGEIGVIELKLYKTVDPSSVLTDKTEGNGLYLNPIETGGLKQVARLGWNVYTQGTPPEQSIPSYALAYENGCRIMLADLRITSDGSLVCRHDEDLGGNTVRHLDADGTALTTEEKAQLVANLTLAQLDEYDFGRYKGLKYRGTRILRLEEFLRFCKTMNCVAMIETKFEMTQAQTQQVIDTIKKYGMYDQLIWAENAYATWGGVTLPLISAQMPKAIIHLRGGSGNLDRCKTYAAQYATPEQHVEISFLNYADITQELIDYCIANNIYN